MAAKASPRSLRPGPLSRARLDTLSWLALAAMLAAAGAFFLYETRGTTFWVDEWNWFLFRRGSGLDTFLEPHNEHLSLVPVAVYKLLFVTFGADDYTPYRVPVIGVHLLVSVLVFVYARRRVGSLAGVLAAALILFLGPGWQNVLWGFQVAWLIALAAGVGAFLMLDRGDRRGDVTAAVLVGVALASAGVGVAVALGLLVEVLWSRRQLRAAWMVLVPLALYGIWWLAYQDSELIKHALVLTPGFMASAAAGALSSLVGLSGVQVPADGASLDWGRPLAVGAVLLLLWRLASPVLSPARVAALLTVLLSFWLLTGVRRSVISAPDASRYLYVGGLFIVLLVVELARGWSPSGRVALLLTVGVGAAVLSNIGIFRDAGRYLRSQADEAKAALGAADIARDVVPPDHVLTGVPGYPFVIIPAGPYFEAADDIGSPADSPAELAAEPEPARLAADGELFRIHRVELRPASRDAPLGDRPAVDSVTGGSVSEREGCVAFTPDAYAPAGTEPTLAVTVPAGGLLVRTSQAPASVKLRRFAQTFPTEPKGTVPLSSAASLRIGPDRSERPWHLSVESQGRFSVCGLR